MQREEIVGGPAAAGHALPGPGGCAGARHFAVAVVPVGDASRSWIGALFGVVARLQSGVAKGLLRRGLRDSLRVTQ